MGQKISRRNFLLGGLGIMAAAGLGGYGFVHTAAFGRAPRGARLDRILASPHFTQGHFENLVPVPIMPEEVDNKENRFSAMWKFLFGNKSALSPARPLVSKKTDLIALPRDEDIAVWMGHSNFYLQLGGRRILIDPTFGAYASPVWFINRAFAGSNIYTADDIPPLDVLAISHDHWDHLDYPTVMALKEKAAHVVCPLGVGEYFEQWGFDAARIHEEDWGTAIPIDDALTIHIVPSQHFSGRFLQQNLTEWCGMVFETKKASRVLHGRRRLWRAFCGYRSAFRRLQPRARGVWPVQHGVASHPHAAAGNGADGRRRRREGRDRGAQLEVRARAPSVGRAARRAYGSEHRTAIRAPDAVHRRSRADRLGEGRRLPTVVGTDALKQQGGSDAALFSCAKF